MSNESSNIGCGCLPLGIILWPFVTIFGLIKSLFLRLIGSLFSHRIKHKGRHKGKKRKVSIRRRGTAIVETEQGILLTAGRNKVFLLPGGAANHNESRTQAAMRELREETGLKPLHSRFLFRHLGRVTKSHGHGYFQDHHTVCLVKAAGTPRPHHEIKYISYYKHGSKVHISGVTREIIERYYSMKGG